MQNAPLDKVASEDKWGSAVRRVLEGKGRESQDFILNLDNKYTA